MRPQRERSLQPWVLGLLLAATPLAGDAQTPQTDPDLAPVAWLAGCWRAETPRQVMEEHWMAPRGDAMVGVNRTVRQGRTTAWELLRIVSREGSLVYIADPSGQTETEFGATRLATDTLVFENPAHDFPKKITYLRAGAGRVRVGVEADGRGFSIAFSRVGCPG